MTLTRLPLSWLVILPRGLCVINSVFLLVRFGLFSLRISRTTQEVVDNI